MLVHSTSSGRQSERAVRDLDFSVPFESTLANEISLVDSYNEDFEQVLHRPIETTPVIGIWSGTFGRNSTSENLRALITTCVADYSVWDRHRFPRKHASGPNGSYGGLKTENAQKESIGDYMGDTESLRFGFQPRS